MGRSGAAPLPGKKIQFRDPIRHAARDLPATSRRNCARGRRRPSLPRAPLENTLAPAAHFAAPRAQLREAELCAERQRLLHWLPMAYAARAVPCPYGIVLPMLRSAPD